MRILLLLSILPGYVICMSMGLLGYDKLAGKLVGYWYMVLNR